MPWPTTACTTMLGGGFFRYTVDPSWKTPHFEKMLYDNAQLARLYFRGGAPVRARRLAARSRAARSISCCARCAIRAARSSPRCRRSTTAVSRAAITCGATGSWLRY
ncbi:MAG: hypothetical protein MZV65_29560 [Chromatiales bacterium]|nr:hypothetical protein [Chromatiales bacterium]